MGEDPERGRLARREAEFVEFFHATWPRLYRTALAIAGDPGLAEDALQSAFAKAFASWSRVVAADRPDAYVRQIVVNEILGWRRSNLWRRERPHGDVDARQLAAADGAVVDRITLWEAVQALPLRQRAVIVLRYYEDMSEERIAEVLGCSRGTVKSQASAALANLRRASGLDLTEGAWR